MQFIITACLKAKHGTKRIVLELLCHLKPLCKVFCSQYGAASTLPPSPSMASNEPGRAASSSQRCCMGVLYYNQVLGQKISKPLCVGVAHRPGETLNLQEGTTSVPAGSTEFKYLCMGHSVYDRNGSKPAAEGQQPRLPYCEGLEMIIAAQLDDEAAAHAGAAGNGPPAPSTSGGSDASGMPKLLGAMYSAAMDNTAYARFYERFKHVAQRNVKRMGQTLNEVRVLRRHRRSFERRKSCSRCSKCCLAILRHRTASRPARCPCIHHWCQTWLPNE